MRGATRTAGSRTAAASTPFGQDGGPALAHGEQRADERADHVVTERVGHHVATTTPSLALPSRAGAAHGPWSRPHASAERGEVMLAEQQRRGLVQPPGRAGAGTRRVVPAQRVGAGRVITDPVGVPPPQRGEPRVKALGRARTRAPGCQAAAPAPAAAARPGRALPARRRQVDMGHLPAGVHPASVRPHGQPDGSGSRSTCRAPRRAPPGRSAAPAASPSRRTRSRHRRDQSAPGPRSPHPGLSDDVRTAPSSHANG